MAVLWSSMLEWSLFSCTNKIFKIYYCVKIVILGRRYENGNICTWNGTSKSVYIKEMVVQDEQRQQSYQQAYTECNYLNPTNNITIIVLVFVINRSINSGGFPQKRWKYGDGGELGPLKAKTTWFAHPNTGHLSVLPTVSMSGSDRPSDHQSVQIFEKHLKQKCVLPFGEWYNEKRASHK